MPSRAAATPPTRRRRRRPNLAGGAPADVAGQHMQLDAAVQSALNVLPSNTDTATSFSLYGLLNKAQSPMGKALLKVGSARSALQPVWPAGDTQCCQRCSCGSAA